RLDIAVADGAFGRMAGLREALLRPGQFVAFSAIQTGGIGGVAVQFHDIIRPKSGGLMQIVDVLGDDRRYLPRLIKRSQCTMAAAGFCNAEMLLHGEAPPPAFVAPLLA